MRKAITLVCIASMLMLAGAAAYAEKPVRNVSRRLHPNIAAAQEFARRAYNKITAAQAANEFDMEGHAQKAKELLEQVNEELKAAAEAANKNAGK